MIAVPFREPFPDALLDLGDVVAKVYAHGTYTLRIDYSQPPPPLRLPTADLAWAAKQIAAWRPASRNSPDHSKDYRVTEVSMLSPFPGMAP